MRLSIHTFFLAILLLFTKIAFAQVIYVQAAGAGNGSSWATATNLQSALTLATANSQIWVAQGTHTPTSCNSCSNDDRNIYFEIPSDVSLYGGFVGTETSLDQRDWLNNKTILSGDIDQDNAFSGNSFTIIYTQYVSAATIVDGFTISDANADWLIYGHGAIENSGGAWYNDGSLDTQGSHPTVRNCTFSNNKAQGFAAAMFNNGNLEGSANPSFDNCIFENNNAAVGGAAMYNLGSTGGESNPTLQNCQFLNNFSEFDGGAISNVGIDNGNSHPTIQNCYFEGNHSSKHGGAIHNFGKTGSSSPIISNCQFYDNFGDIAGAIYNDGSFSGQSHPQINDCTFIENESGSAGGAIYNLGSDNGNCSPLLYNLFIQNNHAQGAGAGIFNNAIQGICNPTITNCIILRNVAGTYGGGIYNLGKGGNCSPKLTNCLVAKNSGLSAGGMYCLGSEGGNSSPTVTNCTFYGNSALVGGGIYCNASDETGNSSPLIRNTIIYGNTADFGSVFRCIYGTPTIENCLVDKPDCLSLNSGTSSNINCGSGVLFNIDPIFMDIENDNFHLQPVSPILDMGNNDAIISTGIGIDLDSTIRINNGVVDLGVYEYNAVQYVAPSFLVQPQDISECAGQSAQITISATGTPPLSYQWQKNGIDILQANEQTLTINDISPIDNGNYRCLVSSIQGDTVTSIEAMLLVNPAINANLEVSSSTNNICNGDLVEFTSIVEDEGENPNFNWIINGMSTGVSTTTFSTSELQDGDIVGCILNSTATCIQNNPVISNAITMSVSNNNTPEVSIESSTSEICTGEIISFSANVSINNLEESYQWQINGEDVGENAATFSSSDLKQNDVVTCIINSDAACLSNNTATSNVITVSVNPILNPNLSIVSSSTEFCAGEMISFTASASQFGNTATYQWQINGENIGENAALFESSDFQNGDIVSCRLIADGTCLVETQVNSNSIELSVASQVTPSVVIEASVQEICAGEMVSFSAQAANEGSNPIYQWQINGENVGNNSATFESNNLTENTTITCILTSNSSCVTNSEANSNLLEINILESLQPSISIEASTTEICAGEMVSFSAQAINGGDNPSYQWIVNDENVGDNAPTFESNELEDKANITCILTSNSPCVTNSEANSNLLEINILESIQPNISIEASTTEICADEMVSFSAQAINGGDNPSYQWQINGENVGDNSAIFESGNLTENTTVTCMLTSSALCSNEILVNSTPIIISVTSIENASINITASHNSICMGENVDFTTDVSNEGENPIYQWQINGESISENSSSFATNTLQNNDVVTCLLTSSADCLAETQANSNALTISVDPGLVPDINISISEMVSCYGDEVTFVANTINGGDNPQLDWFWNGNLIVSNQTEFNTSGLNDGDEIQCILTSNATCLAIASDSSNIIAAQIQTLQLPTIQVQTNDADLCEGDPILFNTFTTNTGDSPIYEWFVNGASIGILEDVITLTELVDGDEIQCILTSNATCLSENSAMSNSWTIEISTQIEADVFANLSNVNPCPDQAVTLTADPLNGGSNPSFTWYINGDSVSNMQVFETNTLQNQDEIYVSMVSSASCVSNPQTNSELAFVGTTPLQFPIIEIELDTMNELVCEGALLNFSAETFNAGTSPQFEWFVNGQSTDVLSSIYINDSLQEGDIISCQVVSEEDCISHDMVVSNPIEIVFDANCINTTSQLVNIYDLQLSPNPSSGLLFVQLKDYHQTFEASIYSISGILLLKQTILPLTNSQGQIFDLTDFPKGMYFVQVKNEVFHLVEKIVLE